MFVLMATGGLLVTANAGPMAQSWGLTAAALTLAATLSPLANGASRIFWGWASDRLGRENTMILAFVLQAICLFLVVARRADVSRRWFAVDARARLLHVGRDLLAVPVHVGRLLRHAPRHVELRRAVHGQGRGVDHRRLGRRAALRTVRQLDGGLLRQRGDGARRRRHGVRAARAQARAAKRRGRRGGRRRRWPESRWPQPRRARRRARRRACAARAARSSVAAVGARRRLRSRRRLRRRSASSSRMRRGERPRGPSGARSATPTRPCGARSSSTRWSGRTCTTTPCATRRTNDASLSLRRMDRPEDRAGDRLQAESAAARRASRERGGRARGASNGWRSGSRSSTASTPTGSSSRPTSSPPSACTPALIVGEPMPVARRASPRSSSAGDVQGATLRNGELVEEGGGPQLAAQSRAVPRRARDGDARRAGAEPLAAGDLISSGTLTESRLIAPGEVWSATLDGLALPSLSSVLSVGRDAERSSRDTCRPRLVRVPPDVTRLSGVQSLFHGARRLRLRAMDHVHEADVRLPACTRNASARMALVFGRHPMARSNCRGSRRGEFPGIGDTRPATACVASSFLRTRS